MDPIFASLFGDETQNRGDDCYCRGGDGETLNCRYLVHCWLPKEIGLYEMYLSVFDSLLLSVYLFPQ